jgi:peptidoglycan hydrolase-like protein with peptidoglycan-binding domain
VHHNEESLRSGARDLADPTHSRRSLRASVDRRVRLARRRRATSGGRRAVVAAVSTLALGAAGAAAHESGGSLAGSSSVQASSSSTRAASPTSASTIKAVQRKLGVSADGVLGPQTRRAIKRFQTRRGLKADGVLGTATLKALGVTRVAADSSAPERETSEADRASVSTRLAKIAQCESGGDPTAVSPDGRYRGKYQFARSTWESLGGEGDPADAPESEQDLRAAALMERQGPSAWPTCSKL